MMKSVKIAFMIVLVSLVLVLSGCIEFKKIGLYDTPMKAEVITPPKDVSMAVETIVFADDTADTWGLEKDSCKNIRFVRDVTAKGDGAIEVEWNRSGCIWAGFGVGWDNWTGKDLSEIQQTAAFRFKVRSHKGRMFGLPFVLTLEDYSDGQSYAYTGAKYFERSAITEEWQSVTVPLSAFDFEGDGIDPTNVKQIMFELQGSGHVYIDEIEVIDYVAPPEEIWFEMPERPNPTALPQVLFDDAFINDNGWGLFSYACHSIELTENDPQSGSKAIEAKWDYDNNDHCDIRAMGVSWAYWDPVDVRDIMDDAAITFYVKTAEPSQLTALPVEIGLEGYDGQGWSKVPLRVDLLTDDKFTGKWQLVRIPFNKLKGDANLSNIKNLRFNFLKSGHIFIDNIRLVSK